VETVLALVNNHESLKLVAWEAATGDERWRREITGEGGGRLLAAGGRVLVAGDQRVAAFRAADGARLWNRAWNIPEREENYGFRSGPEVVVGLGILFARLSSPQRPFSNEYWFQVLDLETGARRAQQPDRLDEGVHRALYAEAEALYVVGEDTLYALERPAP
jgi:outer membrane protein assembly factor BamB